MIAFFLTVGLLGVLGATWLFPLLGGYLAAPFLQKRRMQDAEAQGNARLSILLPAHDEAVTLQKTLDSIRRSIARAEAEPLLSKIDIWVGADACTDETVKIAMCSGANVLEFPRPQGKWKTLRALVEASAPSDWVAFVDAGALWEEELLPHCAARFGDPQLMAITPAYHNPGGGRIESLLWAIESHFKRLESLAGGPVSVHGATVFYRRAELEVALAALSAPPGDAASSWLNDDVVLPLWLRANFPGEKIAYVYEYGVADQPAAGVIPEREFGRRRRIAAGNAQWMRALLPRMFQTNFPAALLALRRAFRVFWAYWGLMVVIAGVLVVGRQSFLAGSMTGTALLLLLLAASRRVPGVRSLSAAAGASLLAPYYLFSYEVKRVHWE